MSEHIRIFVVDDLRLLREGLVSLLAEQAGITVIGTAASGGKALEKINELKEKVENSGKAGNDSSGYTLHMSITSKTGDSPAFPTCTMNANSAGAQQGDPFPSPYTSISVPVFSITYNTCRGFIDTGYSSALSNSLQETVQLSMRK